MARAAGEVTNAGTGAAAHLGIDLAEYDAKIRTFIPAFVTSRVTRAMMEPL